MSKEQEPLFVLPTIDPNHKVDPKKCISPQAIEAEQREAIRREKFKNKFKPWTQ
jgi:hypothetical protein